MRAYTIELHKGYYLARYYVEQLVTFALVPVLDKLINSSRSMPADWPYHGASSVVLFGLVVLVVRRLFVNHTIRTQWYALYVLEAYRDQSGLTHSALMPLEVINPVSKGARLAEVNGYWLRHNMNEKAQVLKASQLTIRAVRIL